MILQIGAKSFSLIFVEIKDRENHIMDQFVQIIRAESFTELMIGGTGGPPVRRRPVGRISLQDGFEI